MFFTDWEGPWVTTDFAYEITRKVLNNHTFFRRLSQYDDYLSYIVKKKDYEPGDTLKLLAPFIIASEVSSQKLRDISRDLTDFVPHSRQALDCIDSRPVVISTSYQQFLEVSAGALGINEHLHGTELRLDDYQVDKEDKEMIKRAVNEIASLPEIEVHVGMTKEDLHEASEQAVDWLDDFFWKKMSQTAFKPVLEEVNAMGGKRKKLVVEGYMDELECSEVVAIGDSISDYAMLDFVRCNGVAVSFNGNEYALNHSNVAVISDTAFGEAAMIDAFSKKGKDGVIDLVKKERTEILNSQIADNLSSTRFYWLNDDVDLRAVIKESENMRKRLRGGAGDLG
ncbi:MAG: hypothetical protein ACLFVX_09755, partial [Archaeoglobaceae archaeon]